MDRYHRSRQFMIFKSGIRGDIKCQMEREEMKGRNDGKVHF